MEKIIIILVFLSCSVYAFGQNNEEVNLIQTDKTWGKEIIQVPFWFAPEIDYKGQEDIRFAKGWEDVDSAGFWTLVFAWDINLKTKPTAKFFEDSLKLYFDGLMKVVNEDTTITIPKTKASFSEKEGKEGMTIFTGALETYDAFTTKKPLKLNVVIESFYCEKTKNYVPLFKLSPRDFKHEAWKMLKQTKLDANVCSKHVDDFLTEIDEVSTIDKSIWVVFQDSRQNYWFGSNGKGVYHFDGKQLKLITTDDGLVDNTIRGIQEDKNKNIYIETPNGISKFDGKTFTTLQPITSTSNQWKLEAGDLWFAYNANDVYRYDGESLYELKLPRKDLNKAFGIETNGVPFESNNNSPYAIYGVDKDKQGNMWFGTVTAGVFRYDGKSFLWIAEKELSTLPDGRVPGVRSMIQDKDGYFWLSNFYSKYKIDSSLSQGYEKQKAVDLPQEITKDRILYFNSGLADKHGNLWMTTYGGGVWKYDGDTLINLPVKKGETEVLSISIYQDKDGGLWLGTDNDGVYRFNGENFNKFKPMNNKNNVY